MIYQVIMFGSKILKKKKVNERNKISFYFKLDQLLSEYYFETSETMQRIKKNV